MKTWVVGLLCLVVMAPSLATAATMEELSAQLQSLLTQLNTLQSQTQKQSGVTVVSGNAGQSGSGSTASCPSLYRNLARGANGPDVLSLQRYLIALGMLAAGSDSGFFGPLTEKAVQQWQAKQGIVSSGTPDTTGYGTVGARTRSAIALQCSSTVKPVCPIAPPPVTLCSTQWRANIDANGCTTSYSCAVPLPGAAKTSPAFTAAPLTGIVPLAVTFTTKITSPASYVGGAYQIDYGDVSFENIAGCSQNGVCSLDSGTHIHTYTAPGTYFPRLLYINRSACPAGVAVCAEKQELVGTLTVTVGMRPTAIISNPTTN